MKRVVVLIGVLALRVGYCQDLASFNSAVLALPFSDTVVVTDGSIGTDFAVQELNAIVKMSTGRTFDLPTSRPPNLPTSNRIFIGIDGSLGEEESHVFAKGKNLYLQGGGVPGMLWAVYDFCEENLGYHWYDRRPDSQVVDKLDTVMFKGIGTRRDPAFKGFRKDHEGHSSKLLFYLRNRENTAIERFVKGWKFKYQNATHGHGWDLFLPRHDKLAYAMPTNMVRNLFASHPEWFSLDAKGNRSDRMQLCFSNGEMRDALYASLTNVVAFCGKGVYMLGVNDDHTTWPLCHCAKCLALDRKHDCGGGAMWDMIADICGRMKKAGFEGVYVTSLAYRRQCEKAPKGIDFPDNFILDLAMGNHDHSIREWGSEPRREAASLGKPGEIYNFYENAKAWGKIVKHISYWLYCDPFFSTTQRMQKEIRELRDIGVESVGSCGGDGMGGGWAFSGVNAYFYLKLLREPDLDLDREVDTVFAALYGEGSPYVKKFWLLLEEIRQAFLDTAPRMDGYGYFSGRQLADSGKLLDEGYEKVKGTVYREAYEYILMYADMLRVVYQDKVKKDAPQYTYDAEALAERAEKASTRYFDKYVVAGHRQRGNLIVQMIDETVNYKHLKSLDLPPELKGIAPEKVTRILPPRQRKNPSWKKMTYTSEPDPLAASGWTFAGDVPDGVSFDSKPPEFQIYNWGEGKYSRTYVYMPKGFIASDRYKLFHLGETEIHMTANLFFGRWAKQAVEVEQIRRCADPIFLDKKFDVWVSVRGEGAKLFPGDVRKDRLFIDQLFVIPVEKSDSAALALPFDSTVVVKGDDVTADFAIKELNEIVKKATGKIFASSVEAAPAERRCRIFVGRSAEVEKSFGKETLDKLGTEVSLVCAKGNDLFLVGSDPAGTLWAVYDFVEDNLGYRWYQECRDDKRHENEIVDTCDTVVFKGKATRRKPGFDGFRRDHENWGYFRLFRLRHRSNSEIERFVPEYRFKYAVRTGGHGFDLFLPRKAGLPWMKTKSYPEKVAALAPCFEKHPEWFSVDEKGKRSDKMQLCLSSKATRDAIWQSLLWWVETNGKGVYMLGSNDEHTGTYCFCRDCLELDRKYGVGCGAMWECVVDICNRLKDARMDGVYITSLAYRHQTQMAPLNCMFPDNFICDFAPVTWDRSLSEVKDEPLKNGRIYNWLRNCRDWNAITPGGMSYWYYGSSFPAYTWGRMSKELGEIYDAGVRSAGYCGLEGGYAFEDLMHHLWFWCLFNPKGDARAEFGRACDAKYGLAAEEILAYTDRLEALRQRVVRMTPCGPGALNILSFASKEELKDLQKLFDTAFAKAKGSRYEQNVLWARISLDVESFFKFGDREAETRARAAAKSYCEKVYFPKLMRKIDVVTQRLDQMANYANLKSDELPLELRKYPKGAVSRVLPAKADPFAPYGRVIDGKFWSVPDPDAVCGYAISDNLVEPYAPGGAKDIRIGLYDHSAGKYLIPFQQVKIPADFWEKDTYKLFRLGRSHYASRTVLIWTDAYGSTVNSYSPLNTQLISRLFDPVYIDKEYETWISVKAQGPKFFPGDTRENRIFIEQLFSVDLKQDGKIEEKLLP